jgi:hypothetical protein
MTVGLLRPANYSDIDRGLKPCQNVVIRGFELSLYYAGLNSNQKRLRLEGADRASAQLERWANESGRSTPFRARKAAERLSPRHEAAVDQHRGSSDPLRFVAGQEQRHIGDILRLAGAPNRLRLGQSPLAAFASRSSDRGVDTARTDAIDADAILAQFDRRAVG